MYMIGNLIQILIPFGKEISKFKFRGSIMYLLAAIHSCIIFIFLKTRILSNHFPYLAMSNRNILLNCS